MSGTKFAQEELRNEDLEGRRKVTPRNGANDGKPESMKAECVWGESLVRMNNNGD